MDKLIATPPADLDRVRELSALLCDALALPLDQRCLWLRQLPQCQRRLEPALRALLARAAVDTSSFMQRSVAREALAAIGGTPVSDRPGQRVGPYRLRREIGRGGMATVWLAERAERVERAEGRAGRPGSVHHEAVALKLARPAWSNGFDTRMARERDILATLDHPHIARLLDAGSDATGRPYLALELVDGSAIDVYLRERGGDSVECLRLMRQVMAAVAHVHAAGIIHSDLKPANIVVDRAGGIRLLDFGVADRLHDDPDKAVALTRGGVRACTPAYASPEQRRGEPLGVASDIYALGVVLHELLCGRRPPALKGDRPVNDDLGAILAQALHPEASRRYRSVERFMVDLERLRMRPGGEPNETPPTAGRRHAVTQASYRGPIVNPDAEPQP